MFRTAGDGRCHYQLVQIRSGDTYKIPEDHNWATVALVSESAKNTNKNALGNLTTWQRKRNRDKENKEEMEQTGLRQPMPVRIRRSKMTEKIF